MNNTAIENLVEWIFNNKEIFNSNQYLEIMNLAQKLVVSENEDENYEIILHLNNYRLPESDSEMEEDASEDSEDKEVVEDNLGMLTTSDAESSDDEEDFSAYTGSYIDSY